MLRLLSVFIFFAGLTICDIENRQEACIYLKTELYKVVDSYKDLTDQKRDQLFEFSTRGITYKFLKKVKFTDQAENANKRELLEKVHLMRRELSGHERDSQDKLRAKSQELNREYEDLAVTDADNHAELTQNAKELEDIRANLNSLKDSLLAADPELEAKVDLLKKLKALNASLETAQSHSKSLVSVLDGVKRVLTESHVALPEYLQGFQAKLEDFLAVDDVLSTEEHVQGVFGLTAVARIQSDVDQLASSKKTLQYALDSDKYYLARELQALAQKVESEIVGLSEYQAYQVEMAKARRLLNKKHRLEKEKDRIKASLIAKLYELENVGNLTLRISQSKRMDFERKLNNLTRLKRLVKTEFKESDLKDQSLVGGVRDFIEHNTTRSREMERIHADMTAHWSTMEKLEGLERELDEWFGRVLALLQSEASSDASCKKCFINLELSVYIFYMNLLQLVVCPETFYLTFVKGLSIEDQPKLIKQIFKDLREEPFIDPLMLDESTGELVPNGVERSARNFLILANNQLDLIFQKQLARVLDQDTSWYYLILSYSGFTCNLVFSAIKAGTLAFVFQTIAAGLVSFFSITTAPVVVAVFIAAFLSVVSEFFFNWVDSQLESNHWIIDQFNRGIADIYAIFSPNKIESLDIEEALSQENMISAQPTDTQTKSLERIDYYIQKFNEILLINNSFAINSKRQVQQMII